MTTRCGPFQVANTVNAASPSINLTDDYDRVATANRTNRMSWGANNMGFADFSVSKDTWHLHVLTYDGTTWRWYVDGVFINSNVTGWSGGKSNGTSIFIGSGYATYAAGGYGSSWIFNRALSLAEIQTLYQSSSPSDRTGLIGEWLTTAGTGTTITDTSGAGHNMTLTSMSWQKDSPSSPRNSFAGLSTNAIAFDGANTKVDCGTNPNSLIAAGSPFSYEAWAYINRGSLLGTNRAVIGAGNTNREATVYYNTSAAAFRWTVTTTGSIYKYLDTPINTLSDGWHHLVATWDGGGNSGILKFYMDGMISSGTQQAAGTLGSIAPDSNFTIGQSGIGVSPWNSIITNCRIYNYALTQQNVLDRFVNKELSVLPISWWRFLEGSSTTVADSMGVSNGTATLGSGSWVTTVPFKVRSAVSGRSAASNRVTP